MNRDGRLPVLGRAENLALLDRNRGVALDHRRHHPAQRLHAQAERRHIQQQNVLDIAAKHTTLQGGADGNDLVRVDAFVRLLAIGQLAHQVLDHWHARRAAHQHHFVQVAWLQARILQRLLEGAFAARSQISCQLLEAGARQANLQVLRPG